MGIRQIYLGGFSNGGSGVGRLISILADEPELRDLFFIAGARNAVDVRETKLPVLEIQGTNDERMRIDEARRFADEVGAQATYVELEADHFLIVKQPQLVQAAIRVWLEDQE
jgi:alpha/beta superfamily hydrolase